jgi:hypothetical protein
VEPDSINQTSFVVDPIFERATDRIKMDYIDRSWIPAVERMFRDRCIEVRRQKKEKETKVNWSKEGF